MSHLLIIRLTKYILAAFALLIVVSAVRSEGLGRSYDSKDFKKEKSVSSIQAKRATSARNPTLLVAEGNRSR